MATGSLDVLTFPELTGLAPASIVGGGRIERMRLASSPPIGKEISGLT